MVGIFLWQLAFGRNVALSHSSTASDEVPLCEGATVVIQKLFNNQCNLGTGPNCRLGVHPAIAFKFKIKCRGIYILTLLFILIFIFHSSKKTWKRVKKRYNLLAFPLRPIQGFDTSIEHFSLNLYIQTLSRRQSLKIKDFEYLSLKCSLSNWINLILQAFKATPSHQLQTLKEGEDQTQRKKRCTGDQRWKIRSGRIIGNTCNHPDFGKLS